jgi:hypothetical protein
LCVQASDILNIATDDALVNLAMSSSTWCASFRADDAGAASAVAFAMAFERIVRYLSRSVDAESNLQLPTVNTQYWVGGAGFVTGSAAMRRVPEWWHADCS